MRMVLGVDGGGTSSRAALFTLEGGMVRRGASGGANPGALGTERAAANLTTAVRAALVGVDPAQVGAVVVGLAGNPEACAALVERVFSDVLPGTSAVSVGDTVTAFAAGSAAPSGTVLISGTGAIAAKITDHRAVATADGYGWLLGDEGSAFWLGRAAARAAARATVRALGAGSPAGELVTLVVRHLVPEGLNGDPVARLAAAVHARPPLALAELAPLVSRAAAAGDPVAMEIVREAAARLVATLRTMHESGPVVLAGTVLTCEGPVHQAVTELLAGQEQATGREVAAGETPTGTDDTAMAAGAVTTAGDVAGAAAWLAARPFMSREEARERHPRFVHPSA